MFKKNSVCVYNFNGIIRKFTLRGCKIAVKELPYFKVLKRRGQLS